MNTADYCEDCEKTWDKCDCLVEPAKPCKSELDRLTRINADLREYAQHKPACYVVRLPGHPDKYCDCGLAQLLEKMK